MEGFGLFGESWFEDDSDGEYEDDIGLPNIADLGGFPTPEENMRLVGLVFVVSVFATEEEDVGEGDDKVEK